MLLEVILPLVTAAMAWVATLLFISMQRWKSAARQWEKVAKKWRNLYLKRVHGWEGEEGVSDE